MLPSKKKAQNRKETGLPAPEKKRTLPKEAVPFMFKPGVSGNPGGRPRTRPIKEALERITLKAIQGDADGRTLLDAMMQAQVQKALKGDLEAAKFIADRMEGKAISITEVSGPNGTPIAVDHMTPEQRRQRIAELLTKARRHTGEEEEGD